MRQQTKLYIAEAVELSRGFFRFMVTTLVAVWVAVIVVAALYPARAEGVGKACVADYFRFCAHTAPYTNACKTCFRVTGPLLSQRCKNALKISVAYGKDYRAARRVYAGN